uniref:Dopamine beta-hydroxylase n=1 Tax=Sciurus vulgaris TaxID=55149 RepID=A0A8D2DVK0_SCIVU
AEGHLLSRWASIPGPSVREAASMYGTAVAIFLVILVAALQGSAPPESPFPYHIPLDPEGTLELSWNISYVQEVVHFQLLVRGLKAGVLFGMSDRGELENADLVVLWTDGVSSYFADAWSDQKGQIHLDAQQDYQLLQAERTPDGLSLLFKRPFGTCDPQDYLIEDGTVHLVYGILEEPFQSLEAINTSGLQTGLQRAQLLKAEVPTPAVPSDTDTMEIRAPDVLIPAQETTYWCYITELPRDFSRHHIIMYEPVITEGNDFPHFNGPCDSKMKPERLNFCRHVLAAWALGAKVRVHPLALRLGGPGSSRFPPPGVHYHNPASTRVSSSPGRRDSSGIRLYYTPTLRRFDAGIMELGLVYTPVMCTQLALPPSGIHIFASQLHTHLTGRKVVTVLARGGREKEVVNRDNHYSPHFQVGPRLGRSDGDVLITSCTYNTEDRKLATVGGFGILEEMCVNYAHYYPQTQLELCKSAVDPGFLQKYFHLVNRFTSEDICTCQQATVPQQFASVPWNSFSRQVLRALYGWAPIAMHCNKSSAVRFQGEWDLQPLPQIVSTLKEPTPHCPTRGAQSPTSPMVVTIGHGRG